MLSVLHSDLWEGKDARSPPIIDFGLKSGVEQKVGLSRTSWDVFCRRRALHVITHHIMFGAILTVVWLATDLKATSLMFCLAKKPTIAENARHSECAFFCTSCNPSSTWYDSFESVQYRVVA